MQTELDDYGLTSNGDFYDPNFLPWEDIDDFEEEEELEERVREALRQDEFEMRY